jgi:hypothetical protein
LGKHLLEADGVIIEVFSWIGGVEAPGSSHSLTYWVNNTCSNSFGSI